MFSRVAASHTTLLPHQDPLFPPLGFYPYEHHMSQEYRF